MTSVSKAAAATDLTLSAIVDGQIADAADVTVPFGETETNIDEARATLSVTANDTHVKNLDDAITAGAGISKAVTTPGGDETLTLGVDTTGAATGDVLTKTVGGVAFEAVNAVPVGALLMWLSNTAPTKWLLCYGQLISLTTYKSLLDALLGGIAVADLAKDAGVTVTAANGVNLFTAAGHGLNNGDVILFSNSGGALPAGLSTSTPYYVINKTTNDYQVALEAGGSPVDITTDGTGTHKFHTTFGVPDMRGRFPLGQDDMGGSGANRVVATEADNLNQGSGAETHTLTTAEIPAHKHDLTINGGAGGSSVLGVVAGTTATNNTLIANAGSGGAHNNMPPYLTVNFIIYAGV